MSRPVDAVVRALARVAGDWMEGKWPAQESLIEQIATTSRFSIPVVRAGLAAHFGAMTLPELRRWLDEAAAEAGLEPSNLPAPALLADPVVILPASNVPGVALLPAAAALMAGVCVVIKSSAGEPHLAAAWSERLVAAEPSLADRLTVRAWHGGHDPEEGALLEVARAIVVYGRDETITTLSERFPGRVIGFGTGLSLALVSGEGAGSAAADRLARDLAIWDGRGCLSPRAAIVLGDRAAAVAFAGHLASALSRIERDLPAAPTTIKESAAARVRRAELEARGENVARMFFFDASRNGVIAYEPESTAPFAALGRGIDVRSVASLDGIAALLALLRDQIQCVGLDPDDRRAGDFRILLKRSGVPFVGRLGSMQAPPVDWPNKGREILATLLRRRSGLSDPGLTRG